MIKENFPQSRVNWSLENGEIDTGKYLQKYVDLINLQFGFNLEYFMLYLANIHISLMPSHLLIYLIKL